MAKGFDTDRTFMLAEISGDEFYFQTISRTGETVDSGTIELHMRSTQNRSRYDRGLPNRDRQGAVFCSGC
jgi:hypothetical protein